MNPITTFNISNTFVALDDACAARPLPVTDAFWEDLSNGRLGTFSRLVSFSTRDGEWGHWEKHPAGEEFVCLIDGEVTMRFEQDHGETEVTLDQPGQYVLVPADTWHTASAKRMSKVLFITPGEGSAHRSA